MIYKLTVTQDHIQEQSFTLFGYNLKLVLMFNTVSKLWSFDLFDLDKNKYITQSCGLAVNGPSLIGKNLPFIITMIDESGLGINSISSNEMGSRLKLYAVNKRYWYEAIRKASKVSSW